MRVAELEVQFAELDGYSSEARAGELLLGAAIPLEQHSVPMSEVAPGDKLRVLLAQTLFADPDLLLPDEPTNNLDINTIRWLRGQHRHQTHGAYGRANQSSGYGIHRVIESGHGSLLRHRDIR